jgi:hypothetical protein
VLILWGNQRYILCVGLYGLIRLINFIGSSYLSSQVPNEGSVPAEFNALVGSKMLFIVDKGFNHSKFVDGTFRVKRVCMDSQIIQRFLLEGPFNTPVKVNYFLCVVDCSHVSLSCFFSC